MLSIFEDSDMRCWCVECGNHLGNKSIVIQQGDSYMCVQCYKSKKIFGKFIKEQSVQPSNQIDYETEQNTTEVHDSREYNRENLLTPKDIVRILDQNVIGQTEAKKALAVAVYNHLKRINAKENEVRVPKSNILLRGATGTGKTYIVKNLAKLLQVPFFIADASVITEAGYRGNDAEGALTGLYQAAGEDIEKAEKGIVYFDEFDKLSAGYGRFGDENTSVGAGVQRQILKMLEGSVVDIPKSGSRKTGETIRMNTENILFICGGAFVGIDKAEEVKSVKRTVGFTAESNCNIENREHSKTKLTAQDFVNYGFIQEVIGRLPIIVTLDNLSEKDILSIMKDSGESLIKCYKSALREYGVNLVFKKEALETIAHQAYVRGTGARGINAIVEGIMQELMYEVPSDKSIRKCIITKEAVRGEEKPIIIRKDLYETESQKSAS